MRKGRRSTTSGSSKSARVPLRCRRSPMKRTLLVALVGLLASSRARAQATSATEQEIVKLEQAATDAQFKKDRAALERLLADDYLYTHSNGSVLNKTQEIAESMSSDLQWTDSKLTDLKVRIFGGVEEGHKPDVGPLVRKGRPHAL